MKISLPNTTTSAIGKALLQAQEEYTLATGRVLTLIVVVKEGDDLATIIDAVRTASHEHPSRVLVVAAGNRDAEPCLDAEVLFGSDSGASEMVIMTLHGQMAAHPDSVVTPLLLPDTPIVAWWPTQAPENPAEHPVGAIAQRRITSISYDNCRDADLKALRRGYTPGDSDMVWARITNWRGIVASALDRFPHEPVTSVRVEGPGRHPAVDIAAGWLADQLLVPVERVSTNPDVDEDVFPISRLEMQRDSGPVVVEVKDRHTMRMKVPGNPEALVALTPRSDPDCLSEELRHVDPDVAYERALNGLFSVQNVEA